MAVVQGEPQVDEVFLFSVEDLRSNDNLRKASALIRGLQLSVEGFDVSSHISSSLRLSLGVNNTKPVKLLSYHILHHCSLSEQQWTEILPLFVIDMMGDDEDLQMAALKALPFMPDSVINEALSQELLGFSACFNNQFHQHRPMIRKTSVETLGSLLLRPSLLLKRTKFWQAAWDLIMERLFDTKDIVSQAAFVVLRQLFYEVSGNAFTEEDKLHTVRAAVLPMEEYATRTLTPKFPLLLERFAEMEISVRRVCIPLLTLLALRVLESHNKTTGYDLPRIDLSPSPAMFVVNMVERHILPLLHCGDVGVMYEAGKSVLSIGVVLQHQPHWETTVTSSWSGILEWKGLSESMTSQMVEELLPALPTLKPRELLPLVVKLITIALRLADMEKRVSLLLNIFVVVHLKTLSKILRRFSGSSYLMLDLVFADPTVVQIWGASDLAAKQELLTAALEALNDPRLNVLSGSADFQLKKKGLAMYMLTMCKTCLGWSSGNISFSLEAYIRTFGEIAPTFFDTPDRPQIILFLKSLGDRLQRVKSDFIAGYLLFTLARLVYLAKDKDLASLLFNAAKKRFGLERLDTPTLSVRDADLMVQGLFQLGCNFPTLRPAIIALLPNVAKCYGDGVKERCTNNLQHLQSKKADDTICPQPMPTASPKLSTAEVLQADGINNRSTMVFRKASHSLRKYSEEKLRIQRLHFDKKRTLLTGSSEPVAIEACHLTNPCYSRVTLWIKIRNLTGLQLKNVRVIILPTGPLAHNRETVQVVRTIPMLGFEESVEWDVPWNTTGFGNCSFMVQAYFQSKAVSGTSFEQELGLVQNEDAQPMTRTSARAPPCSIISIPYPISFTDFLIPIPRNLVEFSLQWLRLASQVQISLSLSPGTSIDLLTDRFSEVFGKVSPALEPYLHSFFAITWSNEQLLFNITPKTPAPTPSTGVAMPGVTLLQLEIRTSSLVTSTVIQEHLLKWIPKITNSCCLVIDSEIHDARLESKEMGSRLGSPSHSGNFNLFLAPLSVGGHSPNPSPSSSHFY